MGFMTHRIAASLAGRRYREEAGMRETPERVVLGVRPGATPSERPPVRIFLGTEPGQARAERVFFWSIEQVRDPGRVYEIYLMKDLAGFRRRFWLTGFTNYRFAIPHFAGGRGRAIYNDVDQIYLADPALLFDTEMNGHGFLSVLDTDTSVMLIDCGRMIGIWTLDAARRKHRKALEAAARDVPGLWGRLDPEWNARDLEYEAGRTRVLHYTTLHTQPWSPFPNEYVYRPNPVGHVWFALERSADDAGYHPFTAEQPSSRYAEALRSAPVDSRTVSAAELARLMEVDVEEIGQVRSYAGGPASEPLDTAVALDWLQRVPEEDLPWSLAALFSSAIRHVAIRVPSSSTRSPEWWRKHVAAAANRHPHVHWLLLAGDHRFEGGPGHEGPAAAWVLASDKPGHTSQAVGLAQALGWRYDVKRVHPALSDYASLILGLPAVPGAGLASLGRRWPEAVVASGWLATRIARWVEQRSGGGTRAILLGRKGGPPRSWTEIAVTCAHYRLPEHPRRVQVMLPPHPVTTEALQSAAERRPDLLGGAPAPRVVLLVGGSSRSHALLPSTARQIGEEVGRATQAAGGSLFVVTSRRTGEAATAALRQAVGSGGRVHVWRSGESDNPYLSYVAQADVLVVTGESESMLAEAAATGKPLYIYPVPEIQPNIWQRFSARVAAIAERPRLNKRGTIRPQQGLEYLCARLIERGLLLPPRDITGLHRALADRGIARLFAGSVESWAPVPFDATADAAARVRVLLGYAHPAPDEAAGLQAHPSASYSSYGG